MITIEKIYPDFTVGKRYYLDEMKDVSYELVRIQRGNLYFNKIDGEPIGIAYHENDEGLVVISAKAGVFHEIVDE